MHIPLDDARRRRHLARRQRHGHLEADREPMFVKPEVPPGVWLVDDSNWQSVDVERSIQKLVPTLEVRQLEKGPVVQELERGAESTELLLQARV